jgi:hypothetical protein
MSYLSSTKSVLRKTILIGWAVAVVWIYLGNLVNFHQHHIWGKQLIPVACSSTRYKDENTSSGVKNDSNSKHFDSSLQFDFTTPDQQVSEIAYVEVISFHPILSDSPVLCQGTQALTLRGPPSA